MNRSSPRLVRLLPFALLLAPLAFTGCERADIQAYSVPRPKYRLLGAIIPLADSVWMVKLAGDAKTVEVRRNEFRLFVESMKFPKEGPEPVTWTMPAGWERAEGRGMRYASLYIPDDGLVVTIFRFGSDARNMDLLNVNRWRSQMNLPPVRTIGDFNMVVDGQPAWFLDLESTTLAEQPDSEEDTLPEPKTPGAPAGWVKLPPAGTQRIVGYKVGDATMTVTKFPGDVGGLLANVNRWRGEVGLPEISEEQLKSETKMIEVNGISYVYVDAAGSQTRTLGVICPQLGMTVFFKLTGPAEVVGKEKENFEKYVRSFPLGGK